ncbi:MAG TPA: NADH-quinone oxidoreductase subunit C [Niabella sp.]|jgi:NADH-quinone oxidoreductase subunit C|nr:NADH-quinone oxidoreductase subunit C [Chitinophagaceae bacterium]HRN48233.1 NADH-quinone oxidoreductase subunit C [Niabella sp.]HRO84630.1 NADH-quinone oxidoreductase subunit C [Niabella sp.]
MNKEELKIKLAEIFTTASFDESGQWLNMTVPATDWLQVAQSLRNFGDFPFDYMFCLTCIDWKTKLTMVYHLSATGTRDTVVVKVDLDRSNPEIESVAQIWRTAEFHEREVYEMFGVNFLNHPDLRLLILPDGWEGRNPMRKDFEDPVNMIKL